MSRISKAAWLARLSLQKLREGPGPWLRAVRRGLYAQLPASAKARVLARRLRRRRSSPAPCPPAAPFSLERPGHISIVLPVHDHAEYLDAALQGVCAQTHTDWELILVDDGSTDDIDAVLARWAGTPRVRLLRQQNQKLPRALSNGFRFATGQYRTWTSADNEMLPEQLAALLEALEHDPGPGLVYSDYVAIDATGAPLRGSDFRPHDRPAPDAAELRPPRDPRALCVVQDNFVGPSFLYRGAVGRCLGDYTAAQGVEDYDYWLRIASEFGIRHLGDDRVLYRYRWHDNTLNARAREMRLFETGRELMRMEAARDAWRGAPWGEGTGKRLEQVRAEEHDRLPEPLGPGSYVACHWGDDPALPFARPALCADPRVGHFTASARVADVLAILTGEVWIVPGGPVRDRFVTACANERCWQLDHGYAPADLVLPRVWAAPGTVPRVLVRVAPGREAVELTSALTRAGFAVDSCAGDDAEFCVVLARQRPNAILSLAEHPQPPGEDPPPCLRIVTGDAGCAPAPWITAYLCDSPAAAQRLVLDLGVDPTRIVVADAGLTDPHERLDCLLRWLLQGGSVVAARPWFRPGPALSPR